MIISDKLQRLVENNIQMFNFELEKELNIYFQTCESEEDFLSRMIIGTHREDNNQIIKQYIFDGVPIFYTTSVFEDNIWSLKIIQGCF